MFKVNNKDTCWHRSGVLIVNFEHISHLVVSIVNFEHVNAEWVCLQVICSDLQAFLHMFDFQSP